MAVSLSPTDLSVLIHEADVRARALVRALRRPAHEIEDIRQDLLTDLIARLPAFDPARGSLGAFAGRLARNRATEIANAVCRERRLWGACPLSLDQDSASDEGSLMARMSTDQGLGVLLPQSTDWPTTSEGEIQVLTNVAVLTEGWDHPPTSCVVLLRPSSYKSTMIQMVGRGLRTVNPEEYPGVVKTDCIILDFGISSLLHGSLEQDIDLDGRELSEAPTKTCPSCEAEVPTAVMECPLCGHVWQGGRHRRGPHPLTDFVMTEIDLLARSSFAWVDIQGDGTVMMASGLTAWAGVFADDGRCYAVGGAKDSLVDVAGYAALLAEVSR